ncbi:TIGR04104 family putative zinc finger protein [Pseudalkalibacillus hwajinpoensis]|uniref:Cxxc_20_cxxc protein n=1 Tax=Guptibacillus hwajinpoensis TaxID=208199 RepID=A0A4U1MNJ6_9BACL|nr:TIGR04104 family putative zinc finger protein [Pseudalkalibacillus hwajinpoensis]TKD72394.1 hypothetical protein FBF83_06345 [Pseudalkalibacillus hwajinpoensis]
MPVCQNCGYEWRWSESLKLTFNYKSTCPNCNKKQYLTPKARKRSSLTSMLVLIPLACSIVINMSLSFYLVFSLVIFSITILLSPIYIQLSNEDEPLW